jgi:YgiT-type zinc finger domain-containing protein
MDACNVCQGKLTRELTTFTQWYEGRLIVIENVPAWVCAQCGETYYDPDTVERIQAVIWSDQPPVRVVETLVYDLSASP